MINKVIEIEFKKRKYQKEWYPKSYHFLHEDIKQISKGKMNLTIWNETGFVWDYDNQHLYIKLLRRFNNLTLKFKHITNYDKNTLITIMKIALGHKRKGKMVIRHE